MSNKIEQFYDDSQHYMSKRQDSFTKPSSVKPLLAESDYLSKVEVKIRGELKQKKIISSQAKLYSSKSLIESRTFYEKFKNQNLREMTQSEINPINLKIEISNHDSQRKGIKLPERMSERQASIIHLDQQFKTGSNEDKMKTMVSQKMRATNINQFKVKRKVSEQ